MVDPEALQGTVDGCAHRSRFASIARPTSSSFPYISAVPSMVTPESIAARTKREGSRSASPQCASVNRISPRPCTIVLPNVWVTDNTVGFGGSACRQQSILSGLSIF